MCISCRLIIINDMQFLLAAANMQQSATTCRALESLGSCTANAACTEADCIISILSLYTYAVEFILLPCNEPPAVRVVVRSGSPTGAIQLNTVLDRSQTLSLGAVDIVITWQQTTRGVGVKASGYD